VSVTVFVRERMYCSVLQRVAACCGVLQRVAACCSVLQCVVSSCSEFVYQRESVLQCVAVCCSVLQCVAVCCIDRVCLSRKERFLACPCVLCSENLNYFACIIAFMFIYVDFYPADCVIAFVFRFLYSIELA